MIKVELQFANRTESHTFASKTAANIFANDLLEMFNGEEKWFDNGRNCYIVTVPQMEIVK